MIVMCLGKMDGEQRLDRSKKIAAFVLDQLTSLGSNGGMNDVTT